MGFAHVVLVDPGVAHLDTAYTYRVPDGTSVGALLRVPVRGRSRRGVVARLLDEADVPRVQPARAVLGPGLTPDVVTLCAAVAQHWLSSHGEALAAALPPRIASEEDLALPAPVTRLADPDLSWTTRYRGARAVVRALERRGYVGFAWRPLAQEERGAAIASLVALAHARGRGALVLLPEVRAASSVAAAIEAQLGDHVAALGSDRSDRDRYRAWLALRAGARRVALGGRAAVFAPVADLGLVVVDDESHVSYKERRTPRFHARAVAAMRAREAGATLVVVGSPPSGEVAHAVERGVLAAVTPPRADEMRTRPAVIVVDRTRTEDRLVPSARTIAAAADALARGERAVLLIHRVGDEARRIASRAVRILAPRTHARLDSRALAADREAFAAACRDADLVVASPVIAKDVDLPRVGCVAVLEADAALAVPEFRAAEEAFATWWRAGRWLFRGGVLAIETAQPRHPAIVALTRWDPAALWRAESARRSELGYPPYAMLVRMETHADRADALAAQVVDAAPRADVLGPLIREDRAVVAVRDADRTGLLASLAPLAARWRAEGRDVRVDVDPREVLP